MLFIPLFLWQARKTELSILRRNHVVPVHTSPIRVKSFHLPQKSTEIYNKVADNMYLIKTQLEPKSAKNDVKKSNKKLNSIVDQNDKSRPKLFLCEECPVNFSALPTFGDFRLAK